MDETGKPLYGDVFGTQSGDFQVGGTTYTIYLFYHSEYRLMLNTKQVKNGHTIVHKGYHGNHDNHCLCEALLNNQCDQHVWKPGKGGELFWQFNALKKDGIWF